MLKDMGTIFIILTVAVATIALLCWSHQRDEVRLKGYYYDNPARG